MESPASRYFVMDLGNSVVFEQFYFGQPSLAAGHRYDYLITYLLHGAEPVLRS